MFEIVGKYNTAKVYADIVEQEAYSQIQNLVNQKFSEGSNIAIMADTHAGKPVESIIENIKDNTDVVTRIRPIYNFKSSE